MAKRCRMLEGSKRTASKRTSTPLKGVIWPKKPTRILVVEADPTLVGSRVGSGLRQCDIVRTSRRFSITATFSDGHPHATSRPFKNSLGEMQISAKPSRDFTIVSRMKNFPALKSGKHKLHSAGDAL